ncbi:MAG: hypothetical protein V4563_14225 [Pseudomonadota bacterium]
MKENGMTKFLVAVVTFLVLGVEAAQTITNVSVGPPGGKQGDPAYVAFRKLNTNDTFLQRQISALPFSTNAITTNTTAGAISVIKSNAVYLLTSVPPTTDVPQYVGQIGVFAYGSPTYTMYFYRAYGTSAGQWTPNESSDFKLPGNFGTLAGFNSVGNQWDFAVNVDPQNYTNLNLTTDADGVWTGWNANQFKYTQIGLFGCYTNGLGIPQRDHGNWVALGVGNAHAGTLIVQGGVTNFFPDEGLQGIGFIVMADSQHAFTIGSTGDTIGSTNRVQQQTTWDFDNRKTHFLFQIKDVPSFTNTASKDAMTVDHKHGHVTVMSNMFAGQIQGSNFAVIGTVPAGAVGPPYVTPTESSTNIGFFNYLNTVFDTSAQTAAGVAGSFAFDGGGAGKYRFGMYQRFGQYPSLVHASGAPFQIGRLDVDDVNRRNGVVTYELVIDPSGNQTNSGAITVALGVGSYATTASASLVATGWTNTMGINATAYVTATAVSFVIKNRANTTLYTSPTLTATIPVHLQPGWAVSAASGLAGTALPD